MFPETIETAHLRGTRIAEADLPRLLAMHANEDVMRTLGGVREPRFTEALLHRFLADWRIHGFGLWWLWHRESGVSAGHGGLRWTRVAGQDAVEVAYALLPAFWRQGYATELARLCVDVARRDLSLPEIVCFTLATNVASQRVMQKAGFQYEKPIRHADLPHVLYRLRLSPPAG